jgi:hypothetical protein
MASSTFVLAAETTVTQILANPTAFDGQHLTVFGTALYVRSEDLAQGQ